MFTGITRGTFPVVAVERAPDLLRFVVDVGTYGEGLEVGASVSIDGVCQTVVALDGGRATFEAIRETLDKTTLSELEVGATVSAERSARVGDEIGGHEVSGHVTGTGTIVEAAKAGHEVDLCIGVPAKWMKYILHKGFVALDGSSLTVGERSDEGWFWVHLIPETLRITNLGRKPVGARVNVELDPKTVAIVDTVERVLAARGVARGA